MYPLLDLRPAPFGGKPRGTHEHRRGRSDFAHVESGDLLTAPSAPETPQTRALAIGLIAAGMLACGRTGQPAPAPTPRPQVSFVDYFPDNPMVHQEGTTLVGRDGQPLRLRGVNLGGWLLWEGWEYGKGWAVTETEMRKRLTDLAGTDAALAFERGMQANFITEADIQAIARLGFNSVRLPFNAKLLEDEEHPFVYRPEGWAVLDRRWRGVSSTACMSFWTCMQFLVGSPA